MIGSLRHVNAIKIAPLPCPQCFMGVNQLHMSVFYFLVHTIITELGKSNLHQDISQQRIHSLQTELSKNSERPV